MQNCQDTFETRKRSFVSTFSICMTLSLKLNGIFKTKKWITVTDDFMENILNFTRTLAGINTAPDITVHHNLSSTTLIIILASITLHKFDSTRGGSSFRN